MDSGGGSNNCTAGGDEKSQSQAAEVSGGSQQLHHRHHLIFFGQVPRFLLFFSAVALSCLVLYHSAYPFQFLPNSGSSVSSFAKEEKLKLGSILKKAASADNTVIITTLNEAWIAPGSIFDIFLKSFRVGNQTKEVLNHLVVVALDPKAYGRCKQLHSHCYALATEGIDFSNEAYFMAPDYLQMMWRRIDFLRTVLDMGFNFVFTDADVMWFRNPFPHFYSDADFQIACDNFRGDPSDLNNLPNGGFNYVKSSNKTSQFYKFWYESREKYPGLHDQDVLNRIKFDPFIGEIGLRIRFLDTAYFGGFCEPSRDLNLVCTMHANCCVGLDNKVFDLRILLKDWAKFWSLPADQRAISASSWTVPQRCGAASFHSRKKNGNGGTRNL